jgi:hypothetical protein
MSKPIAGDRLIDPNDTTTINRILETIRKKESGGNYTAINKGDGVTKNIASGAYQYLNSTWQGLVKNLNYEPGMQYPSAYQAPKSVQDFVAEVNVRRILATHGNHLAAVPIVWYYPAAWDNDAILDRIPAPSQGNKQTVRQYAEGWIRTFDGTSATGANADKAQVVPDTNSPMSPWETVVYGLTHPWEGLATITTPLDAIKAAMAILFSGQTWIRVLQVLGGVLMLGMGTWILTHEQPVGAAVKGATSAATMAAVV